MLNFHYKKVNNPMKYWTKHFDKHFSEEDMHMNKRQKAHKKMPDVISKQKAKYKSKQQWNKLHTHNKK